MKSNLLISILFLICSSLAWAQEETQENPTPEELEKSPQEIVEKIEEKLPERPTLTISVFSPSFDEAEANAAYASLFTDVFGVVPTPSSMTVSEPDYGVKLSERLGLLNHLNFQTSVIYWGEFDVTATDTDGTLIRLDGTGYSLDGVFEVVFPVKNFTFSANAGAEFWYSIWKISPQQSGFGKQQDENDIDPVYGASVRYNLTDQYQLDLSWQHKTFYNLDTEHLSFGVGFKF